MTRIDELEKRRVELIRHIELSEQVDTDIRGIREFCELARYNLDKLSFCEKRMAFESLQVRVVADDGNLKLEGSIPVVSMQSV